MFVTHPCVRKCVARRICLSPRRYPRLSVSSFEKGRIPSTSQHLCRDSFHGNEDHAWHRRHHLSLKRPCPASGRAFTKGVSLSPTRVMACGTMLFVAPSGARSIARSFSEVMAPLPGSLSFRPDWDSPWNLYIHLSRYNCQRTTEASRPLTYYINIIMPIFDFVNICFIRNFASVFSNYLQGVRSYSSGAETS